MLYSGRTGGTASRPEVSEVQPPSWRKKGRTIFRLRSKMREEQPPSWRKKESTASRLDVMVMQSTG
jgi:hypothetical protein